MSDTPARPSAEEIAEPTLRAANERRQAEWDADNQISLAYRGNELAGEVGEACNIIKKLERERIGIRGSRATQAQLAEELADVVICADLIAMSEGIDLLDHAVPDKFNATSKKYGLSTRLLALVTQEGGDPPERREGHSKLVYNKATRTIDTVDPHPPSRSSDAPAGAMTALRRFVHILNEEQIANDICIVFDPNRHHSSLRVEHLRALAAAPPVPVPEGMETTKADVAMLRAWAQTSGLAFGKAAGSLLRDFDRQSAEIARLARLTAERAAVPPDRERLIVQLERAADNKYLAHLHMSEPLRYASAAETLEGKAAVALRSPADGWRPIESAPRDDGWISRSLFGKMRAWGWEAWVGQCDDGNIWLGRDGAGTCFDTDAPTHWMPLPSPPEEKKT